jgi:hypothetical protein
MNSDVFWDVTSFPSNHHEVSSNTKQFCLLLAGGVVVSSTMKMEA